MKNTLLIAGFVALGALALYLIAKSVIEGIKRQRFRRKNREAQFSGSAVKEKKGFWASLFSSSISSLAERIGENGEREVSSYLADLECEEYQVFNDLLLRTGQNDRNHTALRIGIEPALLPIRCITRSGVSFYRSYSSYIPEFQVYFILDSFLDGIIQRREEVETR